MDNYNYLFGVNIYVNNYLQPITESVQFKFPKSKKKRIRKKWSKNSANFKLKTYDNVMIWDNKVFVNQEVYDKLINHENNT